MLICAMSDTHNLQDHIRVPNADVLVHCGDFTNTGSLAELIDFIEWMKRLPHKHKVVVAGNHEITLNRSHHRYDPVADLLFKEQTVFTYLCQTSVVIDGVTLFGSPYVTKYGDWAFMLEEQDLEDKWKEIPKDTQVLITHGPSYGVLDKADRGHNCGSKSLGKRVDHMMRYQQLQLHLVGHIHEGYGTAQMPSSIGHPYKRVYNVATCNSKYKPYNPPVLIEVY